jgi:hypothetical protein
MSLKVQDKVDRLGARESEAREMTPEWVKSLAAYGCVLGHENAILGPQNQNQDSLVRSELNRTEPTRARRGFNG